MGGSWTALVGRPCIGDCGKRGSLHRRPESHYVTGGRRQGDSVGTGAAGGPVILVGHSYGGVVITEAGNDPSVAGLVYIAAFAPDAGESVASLIKNPPEGAAVPPILPPRDGYLLLDKGSSLLRSLPTSTLRWPRSWPMLRCHGREALQGAVSQPPGSSSRAGIWWLRKIA